MTNSIEEIEYTDVILATGTNTTENHPVLSSRVKRAVRQNGAKLIVIDPREIDLVKYATLWLRQKPGTDVAVINGLMNVIIAEGIFAKEYVADRSEGFEALQKTVSAYTPEYVEKISGVPVEDLKAAARLYATANKASILYAMGMTQHITGTDNVKSCANLAILCGKVGIEGGGVNPLRGQNNVQGACDMGALPNVFPGYQKVIDPAMREKFAKAWNVDRLPDKNGIMMPQMLEGLVNKTIRALYIFGENLANTEPDIHKVEHELASAEFLVCQDIFPTETTRFAHVVFPAAAWSEDDGTFSSSERRVNRVRKIKTPPGEAKPNWWIFKELARRMGHTWTSNSGQEIWDNEASVLAPAFGGIKFSRIENDGLQWPCPNQDHPGTPFLHRDGIFTHGKGVFNPVDWAPPAEVPDEEYPFVLSTGRRLFHYHTRTQTGRSGMDQLLSEETADISYADAQRLGIQHGEYVKVRSRRGEVKVRAKVTEQVPPGMIWMAFHFRDGCANWLTNAVYDPGTMTAEYKACAVAMERL